VQLCWWTCQFECLCNCVGGHASLSVCAAVLVDMPVQVFVQLCWWTRKFKHLCNCVGGHASLSVCATVLVDTPVNEFISITVGG
jgi:hypothetical protein